MSSTPTYFLIQVLALSILTCTITMHNIDDSKVGQREKMAMF